MLRSEWNRLFSVAGRILLCILTLPMLPSCSWGSDCPDVSSTTVGALEDRLSSLEVPDGWDLAETHSGQGCDSGDSFAPSVDYRFEASTSAEISRKAFVKEIMSPPLPDGTESIRCGQSNWLWSRYGDGWIFVDAYRWEAQQVMVTATFTMKGPAERC